MVRPQSAQFAQSGAEGVGVHRLLGALREERVKHFHTPTLTSSQRSQRSQRTLSPPCADRGFSPLESKKRADRSSKPPGPQEDRASGYQPPSIRGEAKVEGDTYGDDKI